MDYNNNTGTALYKYQWDFVHDPQRVIGLFEDDADGALIVAKKGTPVVVISDTTIADGKVFICSDKNKKMKVKFETSNNSKTKIAYRVTAVLESTKATLNSPEIGYDTIVYNQTKEIALDSIQQGKYTLICKSVQTEYKISLFFRKHKLEITKEQLNGIFKNNTDDKRIEEVVRVINENSLFYNIGTPERMAHFIGQIGAETGGLQKLKEGSLYSPRVIVKTFPYPKYGHLFEEAALNKTTYEYSYNSTDYDENKCIGEEISRGNAIFSFTSSSDIRNAYAEVKNDTLETLLSGKKTKILVYKTRSDVTKDNIGEKVKDKDFNSGRLRVKSKYINSTSLFDVTYACRMGNEDIASKDGSTFLGKGFIHITGKDGYRAVNTEWNKLYPNDKKEFHGKDINLLETDVEVAIKTSMVYWKIKALNRIADEGTSPAIVEQIGIIVNGGDNGMDRRKKYTKLATDNVKLD